MSRMNKQSPSKIWKRTVYYFLVVLFFFSAGILYFVLSVSSDRVRKNLLRETASALAEDRLRTLSALQKEAASSSKAEILAAIQESLKEAKQLSVVAQNLRVLEATPKSSQNTKEVVAKIREGYRLIEQRWALRSVVHEFERLHWKFVIVFTLFFLGISGMMILLIRMILLPLEHIIRAAVEIAKGNLKAPLRVETNDELSQLANVLSDLTNNTRELLFLISNTHKEGRAHVEKLKDAMQANDESALEESIKEIQSLHERLKEVTDYFEYKR